MKIFEILFWGSYSISLIILLICAYQGPMINEEAKLQEPIFTIVVCAIALTPIISQAVLIWACIASGEFPVKFKK